MSKYIKIGHATTSNGHPQEGDQGGVEVRIVDNYDVTKRGYSVLIRPKKVEHAAKIALACEAGCKNDNIGYSQATRNTLYKLAKKNNFNLATVGKCNTDCSAFASTCAVAAGTSLKYYGTYNNGPVTANMETRYRACGDFEILKDARYFSSADYLKRGDMLVRPHGHVIVILGFGSQISDYEIAMYEGITSVKIKANIKNISSTSITTEVKIVKIENNVETELDDKKTLKAYKWSYRLECLSSTIDPISNALKITSDKTEFSVNKLIPSYSYVLTIYAKNTEGSTTFRSASIIITTLPEYPDRVKNLKVSFNTDKQVIKSCNISFTGSDNWGSAALKKGYTTHLIVNGRIVASSDSLIKAGGTGVNKTFALSSFGNNILINYHDLVQIGIQPWIDTKVHKHVSDSALMVCSTPFYFRPPQQLIDKTYIGLNKDFKRTIVYNRREDY